MKTQFDKLILDYLADDIEKDNLSKLESALTTHDTVRSRFAELAAYEIDLRDVMLRLTKQKAMTRKRRSILPFMMPLALAATLMLVVTFFNKPDTAPATTIAQATVEKGAGIQMINAIQSALKIGDILTEGTTIKTKKNQTLVFSYNEENTRIKMDYNTELVMRSAAGVGKHLHLTMGMINATIAKQSSGKPMKLSTILCEATILGTSLSLINNANETRLEVFEGLVEAKSLIGNDVVRVAANQMFIINAQTKTSSLVGKIIMEDDFENGINNWSISNQDKDGTLIPLTVALKKVLYIEEFTHKNKIVKCLVIDGTKVPNQLLNVEHKELTPHQNLIMEAEFMGGNIRKDGTINIGCVLEIQADIPIVDNKIYYSNSPRYKPNQWCSQITKYEFNKNTKNQPTFMSHSTFQSAPFQKMQITLPENTEIPLRPRFLLRNVKLIIDRITIRHLIKTHRADK